MSRKINNVLTWLEHSAEKYPDKTVFIDERESVTYSEFVVRAKTLAVEVARHTAPRKPVAVLGNKTVDTLVAFFACVYAGCFYVPLNPAHPSSRRKSIISALCSPLVIECKGETAGEAERACTVLRTDGVCGEGNGRDFSRLDEIAAAHIDVDPLYVIFTSGSTGEPKGIAVSHRSVIDFIEEFTDIFGIAADEVIANQAPFDFDVSVKDIYSTVKSGATMRIVEKEKFSFPMQLIDCLCECKATTLIWAVSAMCIISGFRAFSYKTPDTIKKVLFSGEAMPIKHLNYWKKYYPDATFVNLYGPTEITCNCAYHILERGAFSGDKLPIGKPFPNERIVLFDGDRRITAPDVEGEICVVGTALALGYYNNATATAKVFVPDPEVGAYAQTMYRTGDIGYCGADGLLYFTGRRDFQIKYMGHRIELGEIERAMTDIAGVSRAVAIFDGARQKISAFYQGDATAADIAAKLRDRLPAFMVPSKFVGLDRFPLTENGKVDRRKLAEVGNEK